MRAIDADYLIKRLDKCDPINGIGLEPVMAIRDIKALISVIPEVDAAPVKHGRWITEKPNCYTSITKCSVCGKSAPFVCKSDDYYGVHMCGETEKTTYCPRCGAKMDLEEQDDTTGI